MELTKKLKYFIDSKIPDYFTKHKPMFVHFLHGFVDFLYEVAIDALNLHENLDIDKIFDKFLSDYFDQYCNNILDMSRYQQLTQDNKRSFLNIAKFFYKNKGKKISFDIAFNYLTQFYIFGDDNFVERVEVEITEDPSLWAAFYESGVWRSYQNPYTYLVKGDFNKTFLLSMMSKLNPCGFYPEFQVEMESPEGEIFFVMDRTTDDCHPDRIFIPQQTDQYRTDLNVRDTADISSGGDIDAQELYVVAAKPNLYNRQIKYDGSVIFSGADSGTFEQFSFDIYDGGSLVETFEIILNDSI